MKYTPKKVFILEDGKYIEMPYEEFNRRRQEDESCREKRFLSLHGMLMEVTEEEYVSYYKDKRRQRYIDERAKKFGTFSYDALTTDEFNGKDILADPNSNVEAEVQARYFTEKLRTALSELTDDERILITLHYYKDISESELAKKYGISQQAISKRIKKIREKLKSDPTQCIHERGNVANAKRTYSAGVRSGRKRRE